MSGYPNYISNFALALADARLRISNATDRYIYLDDLDVLAYRELFNSTAMGRSGMGGASMTYALRTVIRQGNWHFVYTNDRFDYWLDCMGAGKRLGGDPIPEVAEDWAERKFADHKDAADRYGDALVELG